MTTVVACYQQTKGFQVYRWCCAPCEQLRIDDGWDSKLVKVVDQQCDDCRLRAVGETVAGVAAEQTARVS
jgi:hypothetical protein